MKDFKKALEQATTELWGEYERINDDRIFSHGARWAREYTQNEVEENQMKLVTENRRLREALKKISDGLDESLLLDENLADDWDKLRGLVIEARKVLDI